MNNSNKYDSSNYTDSHCHVWGLGMVTLGLDISGCHDANTTALKAKENNFTRGNWIVGRGWNHELWTTKELPSKDILDIYFADCPVSLTRIDGHSIWCNSEALKLAGIDANTNEPDGGKIVRDKYGNPTGLLIDNAMDLVNWVIPEFTDSELEKFVIRGLEECKKVGLSAVHDMDLSAQILMIYKKLAKEDRLPIKVFGFASCQNDEAFTNGLKPERTNDFALCGIKLYADGALGSYGAALIDDYSDLPGEKGILMHNAVQILAKCLKADDIGFDVAIHAIGDRANREVLDAYQKFRVLRPNSKIKLRIEHAQIVSPEDRKRFKDLNVIASVQPIHFVGDAEMALQRLGPKRLIESGYPWRSFIEMGVLVVGGSDFPIESHDPAKGIDAFVRRSNNLQISNHIFDEKLSPEDALKCYTINPQQATLG